MRTTAERRGRPDRSRAGHARGVTDEPTCCVTNPRRGIPDRRRAGSNRNLDLSRDTRNRVRDQHGYDYRTIAELQRSITPGGASYVGVFDNNGYFSSSTVEGALAELGALHGDPSEDREFTASNLFTFNHGLGARPSVSVVDSNGFELDVCVQHLDNNTVELSFPGETLTGATLLLS